jgi:hypothetical protein
MTEEQRIIQLFTKGEQVTYKNILRTVDFATKPSYGRGEGKTDIYIAFTDGETLKISTKASTADFLENKCSKERALQIFDNDLSPLLDAINVLKDNFSTHQIYYPSRTGNIEANSYTMGWRMDIINKNTGVLTAPLKLSKKQRCEVLCGNSLTGTKRNPTINGVTIMGGGIADMLLLHSENYKTAQEVINALCHPDDYMDDFYVTFRAVNYRKNSDKIDGNRILAVPIKWHSLTNPEIIFNEPLIYGARNDMLHYFKENVK